MEKNLNIVTLNVPFPPDYGGMIDTFYRIKTLHDLGTKIHLHCFFYGRGPSPELESLCESVSYYERKMGFLRQLSSIPFIVNSRRSKSLLYNLMKNDYPILFDGLHTAYLLTSPDLVNRGKFIRQHNIEHNYYRSLARHEKNPFKKLYFQIESYRLKKFEKVLVSATSIFSVTPSDNEYFSQKYKNSFCIPPFHPFDKPEIKTGFGTYILYHGDLSVNMNREISELLINEVFSKVPFSCIVAGKKPSRRLRRIVSGHDNIKLVSDPGKEEMKELIQNAHIHLLAAAEPDGFKIKLLFALCAGRHCILNRAMAEGPRLSETIHIASSTLEMIDLINRLMKIPFSEEMVKDRSKLLTDKFSNLLNGKQFYEFFFQEKV